MTLYDTAIAAANAYGIPTDFFTKLINNESSFNPNAYNASSGAAGIAQFIPSTYTSKGIDPYDPDQSLYGAAKYISDIQRSTGSYVAAYKEYGGFKSGFNNLNASQQGVLDAATAADGGSTTNSPSQYDMSPSGRFNYYLDTLKGDVGIKSVPNSSTGNAVASIKSAIPSLADAGTWLERGAVIVLGVIVVAFALKGLTSGPSTIVVNAAKKTVNAGGTLLGVSA